VTCAWENPLKNEQVPQGPGAPVLPDHFPGFSPGFIPSAIQVRLRIPFLHSLSVNERFAMIGNISV
jgi:hypothetical protein